MPRIIPALELETVLSVIERHPERGMSVSEIMAAPGIALAKRTLQRRLDQLIRESRLQPRGEGRGRRYFATHIAPPAARIAPPTRVEEKTEPLRYVTGDGWLSQAALDLKAAVNRPQSQRMPVGYQTDFLDSYEPNVTAYLPEKLRRELASMGQVGISELPAGTYFRQVMDRLLVDLSWNSSRLEGNTYSLLETQRLLELGEGAEGKAGEDAQMIMNHKAAIEMLADQAGEIGFNRYTLCNLHALLADNLLPDPGACGRVRSVAVGISGTVFHPLEVPSMLETQFVQILTKAEAIEDAFEQAFFAMVHLPYLQAFEDVNKRVSRLAANIPLVRHNLCPLSFVDVSREDYIGGLIAVYELNRVEYLRDVFAWAYRRSCARYSAVRQSLGEPDPLRLRYRKQLGEFVREVVRGGLGKGAAARQIRARATVEIPDADREEFIVAVETELTGLHMGNIARFRLRPSEFENWNEDW
jgi:Fic family protein